MKNRVWILGCFALLLVKEALAVQSSPVVVGSKAFTEGYVLAEWIAQVAEAEGAQVERRFGMGSTGILLESLKNHEISMYPEYTGTISEILLKGQGQKNSIPELRKELEQMGLTISNSLGFDNSYAIAIRREISEKYRIRKISDLRNAQLPLKIGFSHEFMTRLDGYPGLQRLYHLPKYPIQSVAHSLAYEAISKKELDLTDIYSTDAKIQKLDLVLLEDDLHFFPKYEAVILARKEFVENSAEVWKALSRYEGKISREEMIRLNSRVELNKENVAKVVAHFLASDQAIDSQVTGVESLWNRIWKRTKEHLSLVLLSISLSTLIGLPLGMLAARVQGVGRAILLLSGLVQTIPSLALLCFLIPWFGIGLKPALVSLFLYGLLPIVLNTYTGLKSIDPDLLETAKALGLNRRQQLFWIEIPLSSRSILAGIQSATIIGIGTATLAALIGAGGYGVPIVTGLSMNDTQMILLGAIPAAAMALLAYGFFEILERAIVPKGLQ